MTTHRNRKTTRTAAALAAAAAMTAALVMTGCSSSTVSGTATAPPVSAMPQGTTGAGHARTQGMDVEKMWEQTLDACPRLRDDPSVPEAVHKLGEDGVWLTDAKVAETVAALRPSGTVEFTRDKLLDLRALVAVVRHGIATAALTGVTRIEHAEAQGFDKSVITEGVRSNLAMTAAQWDAGSQQLASDIDAGSTHEASEDAAEALALAASERRDSCS